ncbi:hypothetical protein N8254_04830, partial [Pseudomonadales bacterium]|nr:hypothetical protein [Pseudomonadales bacterium]
EEYYGQGTEEYFARAVRWIVITRLMVPRSGQMQTGLSEIFWVSAAAVALSGQTPQPCLFLDRRHSRAYEKMCFATRLG